MTGDIDRDTFCYRYAKPDTDCSQVLFCRGKKLKCDSRHRKWPTPEQFKEEYGEDYPENGAVYALMTYGSSDFEDWIAGVCKDFIEDGEHLVCACTPWGKTPGGLETEMKGGTA